MSMVMDRACALTGETHKSALTLHQCSVCAVVVVEVTTVGVVQTIVSQTVCVAKTLKDGVHKALQKQIEDRTLKMTTL